MKTLSLLITFFIGSLFGQAQDITVTVDNVSNDTGIVVFSLHSAETFMKGPGIQNVASKIENGKVTITFKDVAAGTYAIMALHDENENNRMDFHENGMPKENYGTSNNPVVYGPPQFASSKFVVEKDDLEMSIKF